MEALREVGDRHVPVKLDRCIELLTPVLNRPGAHFVDATVGMGGHSEAVLRAFPDVVVVGIDRDPGALALAGRRLAEFGDRVILRHNVYDQLGDVLADLALNRVEGILMDLGVSSWQLDEPARGFAYSVDVALDMRMDPTTGPTAADLLNSYSAADLTRILRVYGEEKFAPRIAKEIVARRARTPFTTSGPLVDLIRDCIPAPARRTGGNPAKRTFQALRIEVNQELAVLERAVPVAIEALAPGGRLVVLAFQSLEDRIVKTVFTEATRSRTPPGLPVELPGMEAPLGLLVRGSESATEDEISQNPRAASVRLRAVERKEAA
jgi:16S rRNA (cytosine1402-N4)-methyltransferase